MHPEPPTPSSLAGDARLDRADAHARALTASGLTDPEAHAYAYLAIAAEAAHENGEAVVDTDTIAQALAALDALGILRTTTPPNLVEDPASVRLRIRYALSAAVNAAARAHPNPPAPADAHVIYDLSAALKALDGLTPPEPPAEATEARQQAEKAQQDHAKLVALVDAALRAATDAFRGYTEADVRVGRFGPLARALEALSDEVNA